MRQWFTKEEEIEVLRLYAEGNNTIIIAKKFNTFNTSIRRILIRNGITPRTSSEVRSFIDGTPFKGSELTREEYYFLGLLITDGCISGKCLTLGLKESDVYMLEKFAKFLGHRVNVCKYYHKAHGIFQYQVSVKNDEICNNLQNLGNFVNKSYEGCLKIPINFDIFRGLIDGDGCVRTINKSKKQNTSISLIGASPTLIKQVHEFLKGHGIEVNIIQSKPNLQTITVNKQKHVSFLYHKMYEDTDLYLTRKKGKYLQKCINYQDPIEYTCCQVEGCTKRGVKDDRPGLRREFPKGYCTMHTQRLRKFGTLDLPEKEPTPIKFTKCSVDGCTHPPILNKGRLPASRIMRPRTSLYSSHNSSFTSRTISSYGELTKRTCHK